MNTEDREHLRGDFASASAGMYVSVDAALTIVEREVDAAEKRAEAKYRAMTTEPGNTNLSARALEAEARLHDLERETAYQTKRGESVIELAEKAQLDRDALERRVRELAEESEHFPYFKEELLSLLTPEAATQELSDKSGQLNQENKQDLYPHERVAKPRERVTLHLNAPPVCYTSEWDAIVDYLCDVAPARFKKAGEK